MVLTKETSVDRFTVLADGQMEVQTTTRVLEDGEEISHSYHRHVVAPGDDLSGEAPLVKSTGTKIHTKSVVDAYKAAAAAAE